MLYGGPCRFDQKTAIEKIFTYEAVHSVHIKILSSGFESAEWHSSVNSLEGYIF